MLIAAFFSITLSAQRSETIHVVKPGETLYGISKNYDISVDHILNNNPYLRVAMLDIGDTLLIHQGEAVYSNETAEQSTFFDRTEGSTSGVSNAPPFEVDFEEGGSTHIVREQETLYSLSKKYDIPIKTILAYNPSLESSVIHVKDTISIPLNVIIPDLNRDDTNRRNDTIQGNFSHVVRQGETLYGIAKRYEVPLNTLLEMNPILDLKVLGIGDTLKVDKTQEALAIVPSSRRRDVIAQETKEQPTTSIYDPRRGASNERNRVASMQVEWDEPTGMTYFDRVLEPSERTVRSGEGLNRNNRITETSVNVNETPVQNNSNNAVQYEYPDEVKKMDEADRIERLKDERNTFFDREPGEEIGEVLLESRPPEDFVRRPNQLIHMVKGGETLYRISKMYQVSIPNLVKWNNLLSTDLGVGEKLIVGLPESVMAEESKISEASEEQLMAVHEIDYSKLKPIHHDVLANQDLISIALKYNQKLEIIKKWNNIDEYSDLPDKLIVGWYLPTNEDPVTPVVTGSGQESEFRNAYSKRNKNQLSYKVIKKRSKGTWLRDNSSFDKNFYALHRSAPPKSYIRIVNPMNNRTVYVKVIGKLPDSGENHDVDIKITSAVVKKLGLRDEKFVLDWSYHIPKL